MILKFIVIDELNALRMAKQLLQRGRKVAVYKRMVMSEIQDSENAFLQCKYKAYTETITPWDQRYFELNNLII